MKIKLTFAAGIVLILMAVFLLNVNFLQGRKTLSNSRLGQSISSQTSSQSAPLPYVNNSKLSKKILEPVSEMINRVIANFKDQGLGYHKLGQLKFEGMKPFPQPVNAYALCAEETADNKYIAYMVVRDKRRFIIVREKASGQERIVPFPAFMESNQYIITGFTWYKRTNILLINSMPINDAENPFDEKNYLYRFDAKAGEILNGAEINKRFLTIAAVSDEFLIARPGGTDERPAIIIEVYDNSFKQKKSYIVPMMHKGKAFHYSNDISILPINGELWAHGRIGTGDPIIYWLVRIKYTEPAPESELVLPDTRIPVWSADENRFVVYDFDYNGMNFNIKIGDRGNLFKPRTILTKKLDSFNYLFPDLSSIVSSGKDLLFSSQGKLYRISIP